jgi:hypothetical protein
VAADPLTDVERINVRRYCGYAMFGNGNSGEQGYRFFQAYGFLEFRMTNATDDELTQIRQYLTYLATLEAAIPALIGQLAIDGAAALKTNPSAVRDSVNLYNWQRRELCNFMGVPAGSGLGTGGTRMVV